MVHSTVFLPKVLSAKRERDASSSKTFERDKAGRSSKKPKMDGENSVVHNQCMIVDAWKLSKHEESSFGKIFSYNTLLSRPDHSSGCKLCHKCAIKRYCFSDCNNKASHVEWSTEDKSKFDAFQKKARGL